MEELSIDLALSPDDHAAGGLSVQQ